MRLWPSLKPKEYLSTRINNKKTTRIIKLLKDKLNEIFGLGAPTVAIPQEEPKDVIELTPIEDFRNNIKAQLKEVVILIGLIGMMLALRGMMPEGDDKDAESRGHWALLTKQADKIRQEIMFFYNPMDMQQMANGNIIPALGALTDASMFFKSMGQEIFGDSDKAYPLRNGMRMFPILNQLNTYMGYINEDYAKEMGIKNSTNNTFVR